MCPTFEAVTLDQPLWLQGTEPGRRVAALGLALVLTIVVIDYVLVGRLSFLFDLAFITLCLYLAVRIEDESISVAAILPPALFIVVVLFLAVISPEMVAEPDDGVVQSVVTGIATHSLALVAGWTLALLAFAVRRHGSLNPPPGHH